MALLLFIGVLLFGSFVYMTDSPDNPADCWPETDLDFEMRKR
jgi:hypothetical protein